MARQAGAVITMSMALLLALTGCAGQSRLPVFDVEQTDADQIPDFAGNDQLTVDDGTSRFLGEDAEGNVFFTYLSTSKGRPQDICLLVIPENVVDWVAGCSAQLPIHVSSPAVASAVLTDRPELSPHETLVGDFVLVK